MTMLFNELLERLKQEDEVYLLELLDIHSEDIVDMFSYWIEQKQDYIRDQLEEPV